MKRTTTGAVLVLALLAGTAAADVNSARNDYWRTLDRFADGKVQLEDVESAYGRLQQAKRERDAQEAEHRQTESGSLSLEFGQGLLSFPPSLGTSRQVSDIDLRGFDEAAELSPEILPIEYRHGAEDIQVRKLGGLDKQPNVQLNIPVSERTKDLEGFLERYRD